MVSKSLLNRLTLSYSPITNYDFSILKNDLDFQKAIEESDIYVITQKPVIYFNNINSNDGYIFLDICQENKKDVLKCKFPIFQEHIATDPNKGVLLNCGFSDPNLNSNTPPINNVSGIKFYESSNEKENFLIWFSPEKFLQNYWKGHIQADIQGNISEFTKYHVHYVGQSTKQQIWKRLTGHAKLQDVLSLESPLTYGKLPTHEITILFFTFSETTQMQTFDTSSPVEEMVNSYLGKNFPEKRTVSLDIEKALIKSMQPKYNDKLFNNYPKSIDGLFKFKYDTILYTIDDPITLQYEKGTISGGDLIIIRNNNVELIKNDSL